MIKPERTRDQDLACGRVEQIIAADDLRDALAGIIDDDQRALRRSADEHLAEHLNGGIPVRDIDALEPWWRVFPTLRKALFQDNGREGYRERAKQMKRKPRR